MSRFSHMFSYGQLGTNEGNGFWNDWSFSQLFSMSFLANMFSSQSLWSGLGFFILGTVIESGRRFAQWLMDRFNFQPSVTARFDQGDPAYEWILLFLTEQGVWLRTRDFVVTAKNSKRKWGVRPGPEIDENADYVPTYELPQLFRWKGYWVEVQRTRPAQIYTPPGMQPPGATIFITIYTMNMNILSNFIAEAREGYKETSRPNVTVYIGDEPSYGPGFVWNHAKHKAKRPLSSIILMDGVVESLVKDAQEFINSEQWYVDAGIPHRRGYLLHGPPGTGKTSTIYALAGELGLEIYTLSLSSGFVDDSYLQKAAASIPKHSIFLIEDIDCAFPAPRDSDADEEEERNRFNGMYNDMTGPPFPGSLKSSVTMSGLLNVLDGVSSDEGKLFFATTNYVDRLDAALCRPGRIDRKIQYFYASCAQASALFLRFYDRPGGVLSNVDSDEKPLDLLALASKFASSIPENVYTTAELQGFLLGHKQDPLSAVKEIDSWLAAEEKLRTEKAEKEADRKRRAKEKREEREARQFEGTMSKFATGLALHAQNSMSSTLLKTETGGDGAAATSGASTTPTTPPTPSISYPSSDDELKPSQDQIKTSIAQAIPAP